MKTLSIFGKPFGQSKSRLMYALLLVTLSAIAFDCHNDKIRNVHFTGIFTITIGENGKNTGVGNASHIGNFTFVTDDDESNFPNTKGTMVMTVSNGDQIFVSHTEHATETGKGKLEADFDHTITGGTGKFAGATGHFITKAFIDETLPTAHGIIEGTIKY